MIFKDQTWEQTLDALSRLHIGNDSLCIKITPYWHDGVLMFNLSIEPQS